MSIVEGLALPGVLALIKKIGEPATQEVVVRRVRQNADCPRLSSRHRRRLRKLIRTDSAIAAMFEQDDVGTASLSYSIARDVFRSEESTASRVLARLVIAEIPNCLPTDQKAGLLAYRLRVINEALGDVGDDLRGVGEDVRVVSESVSDLRQFLENRVGSIEIDPVALIAGPLKVLGLDTEYDTIQSMAASAPAEAAARLSILISRIQANGYTDELAPFQRQRAELLTRAGDAGAADAWTPLVEDCLTDGHEVALREALEAWNGIAEKGNSPVWLAARIAVVQALVGWQYGDVIAESVFELAVAASEAGDAKGIAWLVYAVESCLADGCESTVAAARARLLNYANTSQNLEMSTRLLLAVADATEDEGLWLQLIADAEPAGVRYPPDLSALIHARYARHSYWTNQLDVAIDHYRLALQVGTDAKIWEDVADWAESAAHIMQMRDSILLSELSALQQQEKAFRAAGGRTLFPQGEDLRFTALMNLVETESGAGSVRRAWSALGRFRRRSVSLGTVRKELESHVLTGRLHAQLDEPGPAIAHFIKGGELKRAADAAGKLIKFYDCRGDVGGRRPNRQRAVALRVIAEEADFIPDDEVSAWAQTALIEAKKGEFTLLGPDTYLNSYRLLQELAPRFPAELTDELLEEIDKILPRPEHTGRPIDDQVARILVRLCTSGGECVPQAAERVAVAFEQVDDIASEIVAFGDSLSECVQTIQSRLVALLEATEDIPKNRIRRMNATLALVAAGNRSPALLASAEAIVERELRSPVAYTSNSVARFAWVEEPAIVSKCLPPHRREEIATHYLGRALDEQDLEANRAAYAVAFVHLAPELSDDLRDRVFDGLLPLAQEPTAATNAFDIMEARFRNPRSWFRIAGPRDKLRRFTLRALAVLATDAQRQQLVWRAAQKLLVSGRRSDSVAAADTAFRLSKAGFAPNLPWQSMVYSADVEMRQLAAALLAFLTDLSFEEIGSLASDSATKVRTELAIALRKLMYRNDVTSEDRDKLGDIIRTLRGDPSYLVRSKLPVLE